MDQLSKILRRAKALILAVFMGGALALGKAPDLLAIPSPRDSKPVLIIKKAQNDESSNESIMPSTQSTEPTTPDAIGPPNKLSNT